MHHRGQHRAEGEAGPVSDGGLQAIGHLHRDAVAGPDAERLFEPFFTSRRDQGGTGLALSIARSLLSASGGRIGFKPTPGGACFEISLPLA